MLKLFFYTPLIFIIFTQNLIFFQHQYQKKCVSLHPKSTRVVVRCKESICKESETEISPILNRRTAILMPFAFAIM